jgi:hypothetical protein
MIRSCGSSGSSRSGRSHGVTARRLMLLVGRPGQFDPCQSVPPRSADQYDTLIRRCYPGSAETEGRAGQGRAGQESDAASPGLSADPSSTGYSMRSGPAFGSSSPDEKAVNKSARSRISAWLLASRAFRSFSSTPRRALELIRQRGRMGGSHRRPHCGSGDGDEKEPGNPSQRGQKPTRMSDACEPCQADAARALSKIRPAEFSFNRPPCPCLRSSGRLIGSQR